MGHINVHVIKNMSAHNNLQDFTILPHSKLPHVYRGCALGKHHKTTYPSNFLKERSKILGELLHANLCGKMSHLSLGGAHYYKLNLVKDDCSSYRFGAFLKTKADAIQFFLKVLLRALQEIE